MKQKSDDFPDSFYRVSIKGLYVKDGKVLLIKEPLRHDGQWELPGGGLDFGEDIQEGLKREIMEETGLCVEEVSDKPLYVWTWRFENQRDMEWYYSLIVAFRIELRDLNYKLSDECAGIGFFSKDELNSIELCWQTNGLKDVLNPNDFE